MSGAKSYEWWRVGQLAAGAREPRVAESYEWQRAIYERRRATGGDGRVASWGQQKGATWFRVHWASRGLITVFINLLQEQEG